MGNKESYTAASTLPGKVLKLHNFCVSADKKILPVHIQLCPTNKCNLNCSFCSCGEREKNQELSLKQIYEVLENSRAVGTRAITITGGGEPCLHPDLDKILCKATVLGIDTGLVSNGFLLPEWKDDLHNLTWCRVSASDDRDINKLLQILSPIVSAVNIDWAFSYVVTKDINFQKIAKLIEFANAFNFTHVRLVNDLMNLQYGCMDKIKMFLRREYIDDSKVIYQERTDFKRGPQKCTVSLLRPLIAPDGYIYPCCGVQYALRDSQATFPKQMRMGKIKELRTIIENQRFFDGSDCVKCYYTDYINVLNKMIADYAHEVFV